jgi:hypothetical protein
MDDWKTGVLKVRENHRYTYQYLAKRFGRTEQEIRDLVRKDKIAKLMGGDVKKNFISLQNTVASTHTKDWANNRVITFGLMGDTQINSKYTQLTYLHHFYALCAERGVTEVYHTGDIDEGEQMRMGHQYECYAQGADDHVREIVRTYPSIDGIKTSFITGNHDASIYKRCGVDIGEMITINRKDMVYLGRDNAKIKLTPHCVLELRHPWDGTAYAVSYKPQKMIESMEADTKPNILAIGHYHKLEYMFYRNIHSFQTGCFQAQTPFMRGKGISAHLGGWIVTVEVDELGHVLRIIPEMIPYYKSIENDYVNFSQLSHVS